MIIDTHCHYNLDPLHQDWLTYWQEAKAAGVKGSLVIGTSLESSITALELAKKNSFLKAAVGLHPNHPKIATNIDQTLVTLQKEFENIHQLSKDDAVLAIGECGLDYFRLPQDSSAAQHKQLQQEVLKLHFEIAKHIEKPLIIHLRDTGSEAYEDFLSLYKKYGPSNTPFILHCVSGPLDFISSCITLGAYIGVAGNVTYKNSDHIREIIRRSPRNRILIETDAPFLPPNKFRGKTCEPAMIQWTMQYLMEEFHFTEHDLIENTCSLFPQFKSVL